MKIRKNATDWYKGGKYRRNEVRDYKHKEYNRWPSENGYGMRWPGTDGIFSAVKPKFGENTLFRLTESILAMGNQRFWAYNEIWEYGENALKNRRKSSASPRRTRITDCIIHSTEHLSIKDVTK